MVPRRELFASRKTVVVSRRKYLGGSPRELFVKKEIIGFPKRTFGSPRGVSQIRVSVRQMMYMDQFEAFR